MLRPANLPSATLVWLILAHAGLAQNAPYTLTARVPLTIVDITVTDDHGRPVHNLQLSDFTVFENNVEMHPTSFEEHRFGAPAPDTFTQTGTPLPPNTFSNEPARSTATGPLNILLLDALNLPAQDQAMLRLQMLAFLPKLPPGARIAVFMLASRLTILQSFTTDAGLLKAVLNSSQILPAPSSVGDPWRDLLAIDSSDTGEPAWVTVDQEGEQSALRGESELNAMRQLARYLGGLPGRKNLIWFGGSFPLQFPPFPDSEAFPAQGADTAGRAGSFRPQSYDFQAEMKNATDMLARAHVAVYPIDGHGLEADLAPTAPAWGKKNISYMDITEHFTLDTIAEQTGGKAFYNTNGLGESFGQALDLGSNFYTLAYTPADQKLDSRFRPIRIKVAQPGLHLTYRNGYYAVVPDVGLNGTHINAPTALISALQPGAIEPTQIRFQVRVASSPAATSISAPDDNHPDLKHLQPPLRVFVLSYLVDVHGIDFTTTPDANYRGDFEYTAVLYTPQGDVLNSVTRRVSPILPPAVFQSMLRGGANARQEIAVPATGDYVLRIAVHDLTTDRVGAIEIPTSSITSDPTTPTAKASAIVPSPSP